MGMARGSLADARDPTAVLITRMVRPGAGEAPQMRPGDWTCLACGDLQFAKNQSCRRCGASRPAPEPEQMAPGVEEFLARFQIQERAANQFRNLTPQRQQQIMNRGSLADARDPTAVLITRMVKDHQ